MKNWSHLQALAALIPLASMSASVFAGSDDIVVEHAWSRASIGISRPGAAYMSIRNNGEDAVILTGLTTPLANLLMVHETRTNAEGVSSMVPAGEITIPPGDVVALEPGGLHVMLTGLKEPLREGETFPMTLTFSDGGDVTVTVPILGVTARGPND